MTDRISYLTVALARDIRDDDVELVIDAIEMIRGVSGVKMHVSDQTDYAARNRVRREYGAVLYEIAHRMNSGEPVELKEKGQRGGCR